MLMRPIWISGEIMADVGQAYQQAANEVMFAMNEAIHGLPFGSDFGGLSLIPMVLNEQGPDYNEIRRYDKKDKDFEFRLRIPHAEFKAADALGQRRLIVENILRAVDEMKKMGIKDVEVGKLERAIRDVAAAHDWLPATRSN